MTERQRRLAFATVCLAAVAVSVVYITLGSRRDRSFADPSIEVLPLDRVNTNRPGVLFRSARSDRTFGKVAYVPLDALDGPWFVSDVTCERVYFAHGRGVCLTLENTLLPPYAQSGFDGMLQQAPKKPLTGVPSRARVSPDGRRAAITVFETGHSYSETGFSTRTTIVDTTTGETLADLEDFSVTRDGAPFKEVDFNFWGATFAADGNRFYATLRTGGTNYLVEGDIDRRTAHVIRAGVECPSLAPDQRRIAFKKRTDRPDVQWSVAILDLMSMQETVLDSEQRSVDDQVEWLDENHVLYFQSGPDGNNIWTLRTDQAEPPRILIRGGNSPAVVR